MSADVYSMVQRDAENLISVSGVNMLASLQGRAIAEQRKIDGAEKDQAIGYIVTLANGMKETVQKNANLTAPEKEDLTAYINNKIKEYEAMVLSNYFLLNELFARQKELEVAPSEFSPEDLAALKQTIKTMYVAKVDEIKPRSEIKAMVMQQIDAGLNKIFPSPEELKETKKSLWEIIVGKIKALFSGKSDTHEASSSHVAKLRDQAKAAHMGQPEVKKKEEETDKEREAPHR